MLIVMTCNTAHYFIPATTRFQRQFEYAGLSGNSSLSITATATVTNRYLATTGTLESQLYQQLIRPNGHIPVIPNKQQQAQVMTLIYDDIKQRDL